jgi:hypothetical protein
MPARLRLLSWNLQNYGTTKYNKYDLALGLTRGQKTA